VNEPCTLRCPVVALCGLVGHFYALTCVGVPVSGRRAHSSLCDLSYMSSTFVAKGRVYSL
jgi:hypothetical protein